MDRQMKITIGICAYNTEQYIEQCLRSAMDQTYENLEIIVIDDGSTDGTGPYLDQISDPRVRVIHKQNEGHAAGREQIVHMMTGEAVYWLDSDDYLLPEAVAGSAALMTGLDADIVKTVPFRREGDLCGVYSREEYLRLLLRTSRGHNVIGTLFKRKLYDGVHHNIGFTSEDFFIFPRLVENADRIVVENSGNYCYRDLRPGGITAEGRKSFRGFYPRTMHRYDRYERYKKAYPEECEKTLTQLTHFACMACLFAGGDPRVAECRDILAREEKEILASKAVSPYKKWLTEEILHSGKALPAIRLFQKTLLNAKILAGDVLRGRTLQSVRYRLGERKKNENSR